MKIQKKVIEKVPVTTFEVVPVTTFVEEEIVKDITIPDVITDKHDAFQDTIEYLKSLKFVATSCAYRVFNSFVSFEQGGSNTTDITYIRFIHEYFNKITVEVRWAGHKSEKDGAIVIFRTSETF